MVGRDPDLEPRSRIVTFSAAEVADLFRQAQLGEDPFDPRMGHLLAAQAFWQWVAMEADELPPDAAAEALASHDEEPPLRSVWEGAPEDVQRRMPVVDVVCRGRRIGLLPLVRRADARRRAAYVLPADLAAPQLVSLTAICCTYVQIDRTGDVAVLLEGFVGAKAVSELRTSEADGNGSVRVAAEHLRPMGELWELICREVRKPVRGAALIETTMGGQAVEAQGPPRGAPGPDTTVAEWQFRAEAAEGPQPTAPVAYSGQKYALDVRVATTRNAGWVYHVDAARAALLGSLTPARSGILHARCRGRLDDRAGVEYFVLVLVDSASGKGAVEAPSGWLNAAAAARLQRVGRRQDDQAALRLLRRALDRTALRGTDYEVTLLRIEHRSGGD